MYIHLKNIFEKLKLFLQWLILVFETFLVHDHFKFWKSWTLGLVYVFESLGLYISMDFEGHVIGCGGICNNVSTLVLYLDGRSVSMLFE